MPRRSGAIGLACALLGFAALRLATLSSAAFNWDEFALFYDVARTAQSGELFSGGHPGLPQVALLPLVRDCADEVGVGRIARIAWLVLTWVYLAGVFALLRELLPADRHRLHDAALGTALLGLLPVFLEWSIQVRTDQVALCGGAWGGALCVASRRRPRLALAAGLAFGTGWLGSQKLAYVAMLAGLLAAGDLFVRGEWRTRRELARAGAVLLGAAVVVAGWRGAVLAVFDVPATHAALQGAAPESVRNYLSVFDFYRKTIGYSQYVATLPTLGPHLALFAAMLAATLSGAIARARRNPVGSSLGNPVGSSHGNPVRSSLGFASLRAGRLASLRARRLASLRAGRLASLRAGRLASPRARRLALAWAVLALGTAVGAFHGAAFAYFLMTLGLFAAVGLTLALPAVRAALGVPWPSAARLASPVLWAALLLGAGLHASVALDDSQAVQRESLRFVHRNFSPDRAGFHPETALFCGVHQPIGLWFSQRIYQTFEGPQRDREVERLIARFRAEPVHYLVQSFRLNQFPTPLRVFWDENYQPYRDAIFVAGRHLQGDAGQTAAFDLLVDAPYRWLPLGGSRAISIDGLPIAPGAVRFLSAARHAASFDQGDARGLLVLAVDEPPRRAPLSFYKAY